MRGRFSTHDMSAATGLSPSRVHGLMKSMDGVVMIRLGVKKIAWEVVGGG